MLLYLYLQDYDDTEPQSSSSWPPSPEAGDEDAEILLLLGDDGEMKEEDLEDKEVKTKRLANESHPKLLANISVYATADKYDIPALKDLAEDKFKALALGVWPHKDFSTVIHEVFESTPSSDDGLRAIVTKVCIKHITDMLNEDQYTTILQTTPPLTFALMQHIKTTSAETQAQQLSQNDTQITNLLQQQNDRLEIWVQNAKALIISAKAIRNCVGCGRSEFEFVRVQHERELRGVLRCVWCSDEYVLDAGSGRGTVIEEVD